MIQRLLHDVVQMIAGKVTARKGEQLEAGSGHVVADLGYLDAEERTVEVRLAAEVNRVLKERKLTQ